MKIVVGVDGSEGSHRAVEWCARYAPALGAEVVVVHAVEMPMWGSSLDPLAPPVLTPEERDRVGTILREETCKPLADANVPHRAEMIDGYPPKVLTEFARSEAADLVVTSRRGLGGFKELVLGSTTYHLAHHLACPFLVVP